MKNNRKKVNNANVDILSTVSIVDGDEVVKRNNNEYIYLDAERGIIVQPEEVETVKNRQAVDVLKNLLLGSFNAETGKYEISNNIELELKEIVKTETSHKGNAVFCESLSSFGGLGKLQFVVKTSVEKGEALSQLFIFERVKKMSKTVVNTQIQLVAEYTRYNETYKDFNSLTFENYYRFAWEEFKIVKKNQMFYLSEDEKFLQGWIIRRKLYLKSMGLILDPYIDAAESELLLTRIEILSGLGTYGYKVLERFEELKNQAKKIVGEQELAARDQNEILEEAIETFRGQFEKEQTDFFKKQVPVVRDYAETVASVKEKNHKEVLSDIEVRMPTVVEIIKRDDEAKKISAMARLDAEVASIEANARPTTAQVKENTKQATKQAAKQVVKPNEQQAEQQPAVEQKGKASKRGKPAETAAEPAAQAEKGKPAAAQTDAKPTEVITDNKKTASTETKTAATKPDVKKNDEPLEPEKKVAPIANSSTTSSWDDEAPAKTKLSTGDGQNAGADPGNKNTEEDASSSLTIDYDYGDSFYDGTSEVRHVSENGKADSGKAQSDQGAGSFLGGDGDKIESTEVIDFRRPDGKTTESGDRYDEEEAEPNPEERANEEPEEQLVIEKGAPEYVPPDAADLAMLGGVSDVLNDEGAIDHVSDELLVLDDLDEQTDTLDGINVSPSIKSGNIIT